MNRILFHNVSSIRTNGVAHDNANHIRLSIKCKRYDGIEQETEVDIYDLPAHVADAIDTLLSGEIRQSEEEIRADERRKIAERLSADGPKADDLEALF